LNCETDDAFQVPTWLIHDQRLFYTLSVPNYKTFQIIRRWDGVSIYHTEIRNKQRTETKSDPAFNHPCISKTARAPIGTVIDKSHSQQRRAVPKETSINSFLMFYIYTHEAKWQTEYSATSQYHLQPLC